MASPYAHELDELERFFQRPVEKYIIEYLAKTTLCVVKPVLLAAQGDFHLILLPILKEFIAYVVNRSSV
jgi:hypothetical protein